MSTMLADRKMPNTGGWQDRHDDAVIQAGQSRIPKPFESSVARMLGDWAQYAADHKARYESLIGEDGVLGPNWEDIGIALRGLLNGETGRLYCGTLDGFIMDTMRENGVDVSQL